MDRKKAKLYRIFSFLVILIITTLCLSTQDLVSKKISKITNEIIDVDSQEIYIADYEFVKFADWEFTSDVRITVMYMSEDDLYWVNTQLLSYLYTFSERIERYSSQILLDQKYKGSGFTDILFENGDNYLVFASFGSGELEYKVIYYSIYFNFQTVINIITIIVVAIGFVYLLIQIDQLVTENKLKESKLKEISSKTTELKRNMISSSPHYCERCGSYLDSDSRYCHECGKAIII
jgi:hypothetical protein